jgi:hypothetical protein
MPPFISAIDLASKMVALQADLPTTLEEGDLYTITYIHEICEAFKSSYNCTRDNMTACRLDTDIFPESNNICDGDNITYVGSMARAK